MGPARFERATSCSGGKRSIQLSYGPELWGEVGRLSRSLQLRVSGPGAGAHLFALSKFYRSAGKNEPVPIEIKPVAALTDKPPIPKRSPAGGNPSLFPASLLELVLPSGLTICPKVQYSSAATVPYSGEWLP